MNNFLNYAYVADCMLGKLARILRFLGLDVEYFRKIEDSNLARFCFKNNRILITRDVLLSKRRILRERVILLKTNDTKEQLKEFLNITNISLPTGLPRRCMDCNIIVVEVEKNKIKTLVPSYTFSVMTKFTQCPKCKKVFWRGTHVENFIKQLKTWC